MFFNRVFELFLKFVIKQENELFGLCCSSYLALCTNAYSTSICDFVPEL